MIFFKHTQVQNTFQRAAKQRIACSGGDRIQISRPHSMCRKLGALSLGIFSKNNDRSPKTGLAGDSAGDFLRSIAHKSKCPHPDGAGRGQNKNTTNRIMPEKRLNCKLVVAKSQHFGYGSTIAVQMGFGGAA